MDRAARIARDVGHRRLGLLDRLEDLHRALVEDRPLFGRVQAPRRPVEQPHAEVLFELRDPRRGDGGPPGDGAGPLFFAGLPGLCGCGAKKIPAGAGALVHRTPENRVRHAGVLGLMAPFVACKFLKNSVFLKMN